MNPCFSHMPSHKGHKLLVLLFCFCFFWQSCTEESIPPMSGVPCESVTFSVPSISSCRFLCHLCTTCFPRILSYRPSNTIKVLPTTQQSLKRNGHRMSHILWGLKDILYSPREDPLLTDFELIFNWPSLNIALIKRRGKVWASPTCLQTAIWEPGTENSQDFYWYTVLYLNVFVMCIILYYRFAVLAQFFKLLFISFITWKKIDVSFFLLSPVAVFLSFLCVIMTFLVMLE